MKAYNDVAHDPWWEFHGMFVGITSLTGSQSVGLQAADLFAYENYITLFKRLVHKNLTPRKAIESLSKKGVVLVGKYIDDEAAQALAKFMIGSPEYEGFDGGSIA